MDREFWLARWHAQEIGFHQQDINRHLQNYWSALACPAAATVFVPLCGKSLDMLWLAAQGYQVIGIELSDIAVQAFFAENNLQPVVSRQPDFVEYACGDIRLWQGDFFALKPDDVQDVAAVYDRASLIALPPEMRQRYADHLQAILPQPAQSLLITLDYPEQEMQGPPFAVSPQEVSSLFAAHFRVKQLAEFSILEDEPRFQQRGLTRLEERVFHLARPVD